MTHSLAILLLAFVIQLSGVAQSRTAKPQSPYLDFGACPFECCTYRRWVALKDTIIRRARLEASPIAFTVKKRERVTAITGVVITNEPGQARILKPVVLGGKQARAGDVIYLLTNLGEGFCKVWHKGTVSQAEVYTDEATFKLISEPKCIWWVKIKNSKGKTGWSRQPENFDNKDACG